MTPHYRTRPKGWSRPSLLTRVLEAIATLIGACVVAISVWLLCVTLVVMATPQ